MKKWVCDVCGHVHYGQRPPEKCPVCGVDADEFSLEDDEPPGEAKRWKCKICGYIHLGEAPPEKCPVCGVGKEEFVLLTDSKAGGEGEGLADADNIRKAVENIGYGLYVVSSAKDGKVNGQCANTVFQLTSDPCRVAICLNKRNLTHEYVLSSGVFAVSILHDEQIDMVRHFGFQSGRNVDKFATVAYMSGSLGCPILKECTAWFEAKVLPDKITDVGTHTLFVADVVAGQTVSQIPPLTYRSYRQRKNG